MKRIDYIDWDEYFMGVAILSAKRSKDPTTQVGACIINAQNKIIGIGYNGFPIGCSDDEFSWENNNEEYLDNKYPYVVHAEANAILNSTTSLQGATLYVTLFPCNECAKLIIQSRIKEVIYMENKYEMTPPNLASTKLLNAAGIKLRQMKKIEVSLF